MDNKRRSARGGKRRSPKVSVPSEAASEPLSTQQQRSYGDCYRWSLTDAERLQWIKVRSPVLRALRVFQCGIFVEAREHSWRRAGLLEGILIYCTEGKGYYRQDHREYEVQPGDLLYCPPRTHHGYWADAEHPWTIYWMHLSGDLLSHYERLLGLSEGGPIRHIGLHNDIIAYFTRLVTEPPVSADDSSWFRIQTNAVATLGRIAALPHNISDIAAVYGRIQKTMTLMNASLDQPFDLARFAREASCGSGHFSRVFCRVTGLSPSGWFIRQKMQRACGLLTLPNIQVKAVAARLGYTDPLYFSRVFKRIVGLPPEAYHRKVARIHGLDEHPHSHSPD